MAPPRLGHHQCRRIDGELLTAHQGHLPWQARYVPLAASHVRARVVQGGGGGEAVGQREDLPGMRLVRYEADGGSIQRRSMKRVFISYRRYDSKYQARMIYAAFAQSVSRDNVFMDVDSIPPGA